MSVTPASKGPQYRLAYRFGSAVNPYKFWAVIPDSFAVVTPTAATIAVFGSDGTTAKTASTAMTAGDPSTYTLDLSNTTTYPEGEGYQIQHTFTSTSVYTPGRRLFDIFPSVADPLVTDSDITEAHRDFNNYLGDRTDWSGLIREGWNQTILRLEQIRRPNGDQLRPLKLADSARLYQAHLMRSLYLVCLDLQTGEEDRFGRLAAEYREQWTAEIESLEARQLDIWETGPVATAETFRATRVRSHITAYSPDGMTPDDIGDVTPYTTRETKW